MYEYNSKNLTKFLDTFNLKITKETSKTLYLIDPYGVEFMFTPRLVTYKFKSESGGKVTLINTKTISHVLKSLDEYADFWGARMSYVEIEYSTKTRRAVGKITLTLK
jgi:hypothetical protein